MQYLLPGCHRSITITTGLILCCLIFFLSCATDEPAERSPEPDNPEISENIPPEIRNDFLLADSLLNLGIQNKDIINRDSLAKIFAAAKERFAPLAAASSDTLLWAKYIRAHYNFVDTIRKQGLFLAAKTQALDLMHLSNQHLGKENLLTADCLNLVSVMYWHVGKLDSSKLFADRAMAVRQKLLPAIHSDIAKSHNTIGNVFMDLRLLDSALFRHQKALDIRLQALGRDHPHTGYSYNNVGLVYLYKTYLIEAERHLSEALRIANKYDNSLLLNSIYTNLGIIYREQGDLPRSLESHQKGRQQTLSRNPVNQHDLGNDLEGIATAYTGLKQYDKADKYHRQAIRTWLNSDSPPSWRIGIGYLNLGNLYLNIAAIADYDSALHYYQLSLQYFYEIFQSDNQFTGLVISNIGKVFSRMRRHAEAERYFRRAETVFRTAGAKKSAYLAGLYCYWGDNYLQQDKFQFALKKYHQSLVAMIIGFEEDDLNINPDFSDRISDDWLGSALIGKARSFAKIAVADHQKARKIGFWQKSLATYERLMGFYEQQRFELMSEAAKLALVDLASIAFREAIDVSEELFRLTGDHQHAQNMFLFSEKAHATVLLEQLNEVEAKKFGDIPEKLLVAERRIRSDIAVTKSQLLEEKKKGSNADSLVLNNYQNRLLGFTEKFEALQDTFTQKYPRYHALRYRPVETTADLLQAVIPQDLAIIEYLISKEKLRIFVLDNDTLNFKTIPIDNNFEMLIDTLIIAIRESRYQQFTSAAGQLYDILLKPVESWITDKDLLVIPDGKLTYLPFEVLQTERVDSDRHDFQALPYLLQKHSLSYAYSGGLWRKTRLRTYNVPRRFLGCAPVFSAETPVELTPELYRSAVLIDSVRSGSFYLPHTRREVRTIEKLFYRDSFWPLADLQRWFSQKTTILLDHDASEAGVKNADLQNYQHVHFATHGFTIENSPEHSGLQLMPVRESLEDGALRVHEIFNLKFQADLVVASSCESGLGPLSNGEGLIGLSRAFIYAGANNLAVSLWKIPDAQSADVMIEFYEQFLAGASFGKSMRSAKLKAIEASPISALPKNWAGFILIGQ